MLFLGFLVPLVSTAEELKPDSQAKPLAREKAAGALDEAKAQIDRLDQSAKGALLPSASGLQGELKPPPFQLSEKNPELSPVPMPKEAANTKAAKQGKDWLLDGVRAQERKSGGGSTQTGIEMGSSRQGPAEDDAQLSFPASVGTPEADNPGRNSVNHNAKNRLGDAPAADPLKPYLSGWMTQSDYALLVKGMDKNEDAARLADFGEGLRDTGSRISNFGLATERDEVQAARFRQAADQPKENPFLKALDYGSLTTAHSSLSSSVPPLILYQDKANAQTVQVSERVRPSTPAEEMKERLKQDEDKKYFPQLKRF